MGAAPPAGRDAPPRTGESLAAVAVGGALGALLRHAASLLFGGPAATFVVNVVGCAAIGVLMTLISQRAVHRLLRPFLGVGVLGGFTTFSTFVIDVLQLRAHPLLAVVFAVGSVLCCLVATAAAIGLTGLVLQRGAPVEEDRW
jgi:CrcB protein